MLFKKFAETVEREIIEEDKENGIHGWLFVGSFEDAGYEAIWKVRTEKIEEATAYFAFVCIRAYLDEDGENKNVATNNRKNRKARRVLQHEGLSAFTV